MFKNGALVLVAILLAQSSFSQQLRKEPSEGASSLEWAQYYADQAADERAVVEKYAKERGILIDHYLPNGKVMTLRRIEPDGSPTYIATDNLEAAITISTSKVWSSLTTSGFNLSGRGFTIGEWDGGSSRITHQDYEGRCIQNDNSTMASSQHATHVGGTLAAGGIVPSAKGMSNQAILKAHDWTNDNSEMTVFATQGGLVSNHSYGVPGGWSDDGTNTWLGSASTALDYRFGYYNSDAQTWDNIAYNNPYYLICKSSGNSNGSGPPGQFHPQNGPYDCITFDGNAKNILTVGAVEPLANGYVNASSVQMADFSSTGPSDDGRIKPDIMGCGVAVYSLSDGSDQDYTYLQGTSMSSPNVAGSCLLLQEYYSNTHNYGKMKSATLKALVLHTADECGSNAGPDYKFGWGLMNTNKAANLIKEDKLTSMMMEDTLTNQSVKEFTVTAYGGKPLVATVVWTDKRGTPGPAVVNGRTPMLVNDLDVRIIRVSSGDTTFPWKLNVEVPAAAATRGDNKVDNVEKIEIAAPVASETYKIRISHKGTLSGPTVASLIQPFSMIVSGIVAGDTSRTCIPMQVINSATGRFDDGSGSTRKYAHNSDCKWLINPADSAAKIRMFIRNFSVAAGDTLYVYDGNSVAAPILAKLTGTFSLDTLYTSTHQALVNFKSDASNNGNGWEIEYKGFKRPKFDFASGGVTSICAGSSVSFAGESKATDVEGWVWTWSFPGATNTTAVGKNAIASYPTPGVYPVTLVVTNLFGPGTLTKQNYMDVRPTTTPNILPYTQGFENTTFPVDPSNSELNWEITANTNTWTRTELASYSDLASIRIRNNFSTNPPPNRELILPPFNLSSIPAPNRMFAYRMAYARKTTAASSDRLRLMVSTNCGRTWAERIVRTNTTNPPLSTIGTGAGDIITGNFIPSAQSQWRRDTVSLSNITTGLDYVLFKFEMQSDAGGYLYLDDIKVGNLVLGTDGKYLQQGFTLDIAPNPGNGEAIVSLTGIQQGLVKIEVLDVLGKVVAEVSKAGDQEGFAEVQINNITNQIESGMYLIRATNGATVLTKRFVIQ